MSTFPVKSCKAHYDENGNYINTFGENRIEALRRHRLQARLRYDHKRWSNKSGIRNGCMVMTFLAFNSLVYHTLKKDAP